MANPIYPAGTVRALLDGPHVTPATRAVIRSRLEAGAPAPLAFFDPDAFATLRAAVARLIPQEDRENAVDLAAAIDARLGGNLGDGWRYAAMPPDGEAYRRGLAGLDECARGRRNVGFVALGAKDQDAVLTAVQRGEVDGPTWREIPAARFFEELLAEVCECYYSDPLSQEEIGYVGMADQPGWEATGLNRLEPREPRPSVGRRG